MEWLAHDETERTTLPPWTQGTGPDYACPPYTARVLAEGLVLTRGRRASALLWDDLLVPILVGSPERLFLTAPREPPRRPWFELQGTQVGALYDVVRARLEALDHRGYRGARRTRDPLPPDVVLARVLAHEPLPGAVEVAAATPGVWKSATLGAVAGGATLGVYGLAYGPIGMAIAAAVGSLSGGSLLGGMELMKKRRAGRVLVLTPDAYVGGLDGTSVRAVPWEGVGAFRDGIDTYGDNALEVVGPDGNLVSRVGARYFGTPLEVIVAFAEAYRRAAQR